MSTYSNGDFSAIDLGGGQFEMKCLRCGEPFICQAGDHMHCKCDRNWKVLGVMCTQCAKGESAEESKNTFKTVMQLPEKISKNEEVDQDAKYRQYTEAAYRRGCHQVIGMLRQWASSNNVQLTDGVLEKLEGKLGKMRADQKEHPGLLHEVFDSMPTQ